MRVAQDTVVVFDYTLRDEQGEVIDSGAGPDGMAYIHGHDMLVPGLEKALAGQEVGAHLEVAVPPADGYGEVDDQDEVRVPRSAMPPDMELEPGAELEGTDEDGNVQTFWVVEVEGDEVIMTRNHPLAGMTLRFDVTITKVRAATAEELEHGHPHEGEHGHDGHHHHHH
jgi:FKBP-type peptidyl-prolyl cis-trans isomerase SlyD